MSSGQHTEITHALQSSTAKQVVLAALLRHYPSGREQDALKRITPDQLVIEPFGKQGLSRAVYMVSDPTKQLFFVLGVNLPRDPNSTLLPRAQAQHMQAFQKRLISSGVRCSEYIEHSLHIPGVEHPCELITFLHGYQVRTAAALSDTELQSMAHTLARMHISAQNYAPPGYSKPHRVTSQQLPHGFVHADYNVENVLFDSDSHQVSGVIDFEMSHYNTFVFDIARFTARKLMDVTVVNGAPQFTLHADKMMAFVKAYAEIRPISAKEAQAIVDLTLERIKNRIDLLKPQHPNIADAQWQQAYEAYAQRVIAEFKPAQLAAPARSVA